MEKLARVHVEKIIRGGGHQFFGVTFEKKDKTLRTMNARLGVEKFLVGGENKVVKPDNSYMTVWDSRAKGYRTINLATITNLNIHGEKYKVVD